MVQDAKMTNDKWILVILGILILCISAALSLTEGEIAAIQQLRTDYPTMTASWPSDPIQVCNYESKSLNLGCSTGEDSHVTSLDMVSTNPRPIPKTVEAFLWLEELNVPASDIQNTSFSCDQQANYSAMANLKYFNLLVPVCTLSASISLLPSSLTTLYITLTNDTQHSQERTSMSRFTALQKLQLSGVCDSSLDWEDLSTSLANLTSFSFTQCSPEISPASTSNSIFSRQRLSTGSDSNQSVRFDVSNFHRLQDLSVFLSRGAELAFPAFEIGGNLSALVSLKTLFLNGPSFENRSIVPDEIGDWTKLEFFTVMGAGKGVLPESIKFCTSLRSFYVYSGVSLTGTIPDGFGMLQNLASVILKSNSLQGTLPKSLFSSGNLQSLDLSFNQLEGALPDGVAPSYLCLSRNRFNGTLEGLIWPKQGIKLLIEGNQFSGTLPQHIKYTQLLVSRNKFHGAIPQIEALPAKTTVELLDYSHNQFDSFAPDLYFRRVKTVDLSFNNFTNLNNPTIFCEVQELIATHNAIQGDLAGFRAPIQELCVPFTLLKLDHNLISFSISDVKPHSWRSLKVLTLSNNRVYGSLDGLLEDTFPELLVLDLFNNCLNGSLHISTFLRLFDGPLDTLSISGNPNIQPLHSIDGLDTSNSLFPLSAESNSQCLQLLPKNNSLARFNYDVGLFSFLQCQCIPRYYGQAPDKCFDCPDSGNCKTGTIVIIPEGSYAYQADDLKYIGQSGPLAIEPCALSPLLKEFSNCKGSTILINQTSNLNNLQLGFVEQCHEGSAGRKCSKCICETPTSCFYPRGPLCIICSSGPLASTDTALIVIGIILILLLILSPVMYMVLKSSRRVETKNWKTLSLGKRLFYRSLHALRMGYAPITITFIQIISTTAKLQDIALKAWLQILNGQFSGTGLACLFPTLRNPMAQHLLHLLLPFALCGIVVMSIVLGELIWRLKNRKQNSVGSDHEVQGSQPLLGFSSTFASKTRYYPWTALATSAGISVIQFFYFGISVSSIEYFIADRSRIGRTREIFVEDYPWMPYSDATALRSISVPFLVVVVFGLPFGLLIVLLHFGRSASRSTELRLYIGSMMDRYRAGCSWWELVRIVVKLLISIVLKAIIPSSAFRPTATIGILVATGFLQSNLNTWKRHWENVLEPIGFGLMIVSFLVAQLGPSLSDLRSVIIMSFTANVIYIVALLAIWAHAALTEIVPLPAHDPSRLDNDALQDTNSRMDSSIIFEDLEDGFESSGDEPSAEGSSKLQLQWTESDSGLDEPM